MSYSKIFYIGAYIQAKAKPIIEENESLFCENCPSIQFKDKDKYCPQCGNLLSKKTQPEEKIPDIYDLIPEEEYQDILCQVDDRENDNLILIGNADIANFKSQYEEIIGILKDRVESLEVKFGAIRYYI